MAKKPQSNFGTDQQLTLAQAAAMRGVSRQAMLYWVTYLGLKSHRVGKLRCVWKADLDAFTPPKAGRKKTS